MSADNNNSNNNQLGLREDPASAVAKGWSAQSPARKAALGVGGVVVGLLVVVKILPALVAAMGVGALLAILFLPYWLPTIIAFARKHPSKGAVFALNFFLGWTFIGWVVSLVWSLGDNSPRTASQTVIVNTTTVAASAPAPHPFQAGDVVNGQRFDGLSWQPLTSPTAPVRS